MNVLILGMGGEVSKGILKAVRQADIPCKVIGACISPDSEGLYMCDRAYISPYANDPAFIGWLADCCCTEQVDIVLSGVEENICAISNRLDYLHKNTNTVFRVSSPEHLLIGGDKYETCKWLEENGFPFPRYARSEDIVAVERLVSAVGYNIIAKPRDGKGSRGVFRITGKEELQRSIRLSGYVLEEYVGDSGQEYTVGCYCGLHGEFPKPIVMRRQLKNGSSWKVEVTQNEEIERLCGAICKKFLPDGPLNIQLRIDSNGKPVPFEFNVRFSGTTPMRAHFGFCDVKAMLFESLLGKDISECFSIRKGVAFRYAEELYLDEPAILEPTGRLIW